MKKFVQDVELILQAPLKKKYPSLLLEEYPFDEQLLSLSALYRESRKLFVKIGGHYIPRVCSNLRSLSATDLFKNEIEYSPIFSELLWFKDHCQEVYDQAAHLSSLTNLSGISIFHEQNHRILWRLLPRAPKNEFEFCRYLNFAESLIVTLDLALGDELGAKLSAALERAGTIYRPGGEDSWSQKSKSEYRQYLLAVFYVTYLELEIIDRRDILKCLEYVLGPAKTSHTKKMYKDAIARGLQLSELFSRNTNREWQAKYWSQAQKSLAKLQKNFAAAEVDVLVLPKDPLDFESEFAIVNRVLNFFKI